MNIVVCVKQVPDTTAVKIDPKTGTLIRDGVPKSSISLYEKVPIFLKISFLRVVPNPCEAIDAKYWQVKHDITPRIAIKSIINPTSKMYLTSPVPIPLSVMRIIIVGIDISKIASSNLNIGPSITCFL